MAEPSERLSKRDAAHLGEQIAGLTDAGLPLASGLRALGEELDSGRLRRVLERLSRALESGTSLESALEAQRGGVPGHLRGLVRAGARTGRIGEVLGRFAGYANIGDDLRRSLWLRLAYPILTLVLATVVFTFACVFLMTGFDAMFRDFGVSLPFLTRMMFVISRLVTQVWWPLTIGLAGLTALWLTVGLSLGTATRRGLACYLPLIGPVWRWTAMAEFCHLLGLMLESEVPLVEALPLAGEGAQNMILDATGRALTRDVASGQPLSTALARRPLFSRGSARLLEWAEKHRSLPDALHMLGELFESRARSQARFASTVCSVLAVVSILGGIFMMISAVLLPMVSLISRLSG